MNSPGLRERKKQKTRWAIQEHALRLFAEQGYDATTVDQIAAAAEISPSTFFRYFPTKEDVVIDDEYDALLLERLLSAPAEMGPMTALRHTMRETFGMMTADDLAKIFGRTQLTMGVPALRARSLQNFLSTLSMLSEGIATRTGRTPDDLAVRVMAGAVVGALVATLELWIEGGAAEPGPEMMDRTMAQLEAGFTLQ